MTTNRIPTRRQSKPRFTDETIATFLRAEKLRPIHLAHILECPTDDGTHCAECEEYLSLRCPAAPHCLIAFPDNRDELLRSELLAEVERRKST